jgi:hypothetical protein
VDLARHEQELAVALDLQDQLATGRGIIQQDAQAIDASY